MKKLKNLLFAGVIGFALCLGMVGCAADHTYKQIDVTMDEVEQKIKDGDTFNLLVERDNCPFCEQLNEYIEDTKENHGVTVYRLDVTDFEFKREKEEDTTLISDHADGKKFLETFPYFLYTPTIYKIDEGEITEAAIGYNSEQEEMSLWNVDSTIDWDKADTIGVWEYLES
ncbi:hypothetical protein C815_00421 [Firmicutes bacterium M10-2]|nr:hypothetical protein C815_00421 [Firmicutes bacterium M10-2]